MGWPQKVQTNGPSDEIGELQSESWQGLCEVSASWWQGDHSGSTFHQLPADRFQDHVPELAGERKILLAEIDLLAVENPSEVLLTQPQAGGLLGIDPTQLSLVCVSIAVDPLRRVCAPRGPLSKFFHVRPSERPVIFLGHLRTSSARVDICS